MTDYKNPFKNIEFDRKFEALLDRIANYIEKEHLDLDHIKIEELVGWHDTPVQRIIYPSDKCPDKIKTVVEIFIKEEFNSI